jgi:regulator of sigma E protease
MVTSVLAAIVVLGLLIFVHELGHFLAAKRVGVGVVRFSLGFGPVVFARKIGETEYCLSAIPLGGYVKMIGQEDDGSDPDPETATQENSFAVKPLWARAFIVSAGPLGNFVLAWLLFAALYATGIQVTTSQVGEVASEMPAAEAGLAAGDRITAVDGKPVRRWDEVSDAIRGSAGAAVVLTVDRSGAEKKITVTPRLSETENLFGEPTRDYLIGIKPSGDFIIERSNPLTALWQGARKTTEWIGLTFLTLVKLFEGQVDTSNLGGPIRIMKMAGETAHLGLIALMSFMAVLSINLGVLNLLPVPVLDGGHLAFMVIEKVLGRPLELRQREIATQVGMFLLICLMGFALYNDLHHLVAG